MQATWRMRKSFPASTRGPSSSVHASPAPPAISKLIVVRRVAAMPPKRRAIAEDRSDIVRARCFGTSQLVRARQSPQSDHHASVVHTLEPSPDLPLYLFLERGAVHLHLSEHAGDASPGTLVYYWIDDVDAVAAEFGVEVTNQPWAREVELTDPDGNRLRIATVHHG